ncbi:MAG: transglycosylase domain-containing protein [Saprospiraceae bacterium]|nr:transglycosylase domain-containing protein [Saprospiraceae bacterium]
MWGFTYKGILRLLILAVLIPAFLLGTLYLLVAFEVVDDLPSRRQLKRIQNPLASDLFAEGGELMGKYYIENRSNLEYEDLNDHFKDALIATEDRRFYKHNGVDVRGLSRVLFKTILLRKENSGGGSTITQQLAKNLYPRKNYKIGGTIINKFREMVIAQRIERVYSKKEILILYANTVSFGERAFGLATASERFFNKPANALHPEEAALLVGLLKATTYYNPRKNPENALRRRNVVFNQMVKYKQLTPESAEQLKALPIELDYQPYQANLELGRYFKAHIKNEFDAWSKAHPKKDGSYYDLNTDGLKVYTTIDFGLQQEAERYMKIHMAKVQKNFDVSWKGGRKFGKGTSLIDEQILSDPNYQKIRKKSGKEKALAAYTTHDMRNLWTWDGVQAKSATKIDSIKHYLGMIHGGILAADPNTGHIKVWVGGNDYSKFQYDNILRPRQAGSLFKPIVYLSALESGVEPCDYFANERQVYKAYKDWSPRNSNNEYGGYIPVQQALAQSINTVSVQVLFETGVENVVKTARDLGIESELSEVPSIVLGTSDVSLYEMVGAYSVLASGGYKRPLSGIVRIEDKDGQIIYEAPEYKAREVKSGFRYSNINMLNGMLQQVTTKGTAKRIYNHDIPFYVMGKTGTTQNQSDGWFIGFTDQLVVGAWVGAEDRRVHFRNLSTGAGGRTALPLVGAVFEQAAEAGMRPTKWNTEAYFRCDDYLSTEDYELATSGSFLTRMLESLGDRNALPKSKEQKGAPVEVEERELNKKEERKLRKRRKKLERQQRKREKS